MHCARNFCTRNNQQLPPVGQAVHAVSKVGASARFMDAPIRKDEMAPVFSQDHRRLGKTSAASFVTRLVYRAFRSTLLSYPADFGYRANVLATSLDIN
jgi:hypothetical protein